MATKVRKNNEAVNKLNKMFRDCGFPNVKLVVTNSVDKDGHTVEERNLIVNGYIYHYYGIFRIIIKDYVKTYAYKYKSFSNFKINMALQDNLFSFYKMMDDEKTEWERIRWEQTFVLVKCLVKSLRFSNNIDKDLDEIFGSEDCGYGELSFAESTNHFIMKYTDKERIKDYDIPYDD